MNGKDLLMALGNINPAYYVEAENDSPNSTWTHKSFRKPLLAAVILALTLLLTISAVACAYGWLERFFDTQSDMPLSSDQAAHIERNEQIISQSQTHDSWTIQLKSVINDGRTAYIILGVTAPTTIDLESAESAEYYLGGEFADLISNNQGFEIYSETSGWEPDNDKLANTMDYLFRIEIREDTGTTSPFGADVEWNIHIENIICQWENTEYYRNLLTSKYKNQDNFMLTDEEINQLYQQEIVAKGVWDFYFTFDQTSTGIELVSVPIVVNAYTRRNSIASYQEVTITRFTLNSFSAQIYHTADALVTFTNPAKETVVVVMRDGTEIELNHYGGPRTMTTPNSDTPIVLSEVDHIRMPDGTVMHIPKQ